MRIPSLMLALALATAGHAVTVNITPGQLQASLGDSQPQDLVITGTANFQDLDYAASLRSLKTLDLSGVSIAAYKGKTNQNLAGTYPANQLPAYSLSGCTATTIVLPSTVESIGDGALMGSSITSLTIPASVKRIGRSAFADCDGLKEVNIPNTAYGFGDGVFSECDNLEKATFATTDIPARAFYNCPRLKEVNTPWAAIIGERAFAGCTSLTSFTITNGVKEIGDEAFAGSGLKNIDLGTSNVISKIGNRAFANCPALTSITLKNTIAEIGDGAFFGDNELTSITLPSGLKELRPLSLAGTSKLQPTPSTFNTQLQAIGDHAMAGMEAATHLTLPADLGYIGDQAMAGMTGLQSIEGVKMKQVPELGREVWKGVNQHNVALFLSPDLVPEFLQADQWKEFDILHSSITNEPQVLTGQCRLRYHVEGSQITVEAEQPMETVTLYDLAGQLVDMARAKGQTTASVMAPTNGHDVFILAVTLSAGGTTTLKVSK